MNMLNNKLAAIVAISVSGLSLSNSASATCWENCYDTYYRNVTNFPEMSVHQQTVDLGDGNWQYSFEITPSYANGPFVVSRFTFPLFQDSDIRDLRIDLGGGYMAATIEDTPFEGAPKSLVLHHNGPVSSMPPVAAAFSFLSSFAPDAQATASLYLGGLSYTSTSWDFGRTTTVITSGIAPSTPFLYSVNMPGSSMAMAAAVPEPTSLSMLMLGLIGIFAVAFRRQGRANKA